MVRANYAYYGDWNNNGAFDHAYSNISAYVHRSHWELGATQGPPHHCESGVLTLVLDNTTSIFSTLYSSSPLYGSLLPGRRIKCTMDTGGGETGMFYGYLDTILPYIERGKFQASLRAYGILYKLKDAETEVALQEDITTGNAIIAVLDAYGLASGDRDIETGQSTISKYWLEENSNVMSALWSLVDEELGRLCEGKDGKIIFEDRAHVFTDARSLNVQATYGTGTLNIWDLRQEDPIKSVYNAVKADCRTFNKSEEKILVNHCDVANDLGGTPLIVPASDSIEVYLKYRGGPGVYDWTILDMNANTAADGSGSDITSDVTPVKTELGNRLKVVLTNANVADAHIIKLRAWGYAIVEEDPVELVSNDTTSQGKYGKRRYPYTSNWITDQDDGQAKLDHITTRWANPVPRISFLVKANFDQTHLEEVEARCISDRIHVTAGSEFGLYIDDDFIIDRLVHDVDSGGIHDMRVYCTKAPTDQLAASGTAYTSQTIYSEVPEFSIIAGSFTSNSPSAEYVAWTEIVVRYKKEFFIIPASNTSNEFLYWDYSSPNVISSGAAYPATSLTVFYVGHNESGTWELNGNLDRVYLGLAANGNVNSNMAVADSLASSATIKARYKTLAAAGLIEETFDAGTTCLDYWTTSIGTDPTFPSRGENGGKVMCATDYTVMRQDDYIPFDPGKLYPIEIRVRRYTTDDAAEDNFTVYFRGYDEDKTAVDTPAAYTAILSLDLSSLTLQVWERRTIWVQGTSATADGTGTETDPYTMPQNTKYIRSQMNLNAGGDNSNGNVSEVDCILCHPVDPLLSTANNTSNNTSNVGSRTSTEVNDDIDSAQADADTANSILATIASDTKFTPVEKQAARLLWDAIADEKAGLDSTATSYGITTEKTTYDNAFQALADYLNAGTWSSGVPLWISDAQLGNTETIIGSTFRSKWSDYYDAKIALLNKFATEAKLLADTAQSNVDDLTADISRKNWSQNCTFSVTDADTVAWGAGTLRLGDSNYSIGAGNTGNMAARTYIYFDPAVSTTAYQVTTTLATAIGSNKKLIAIAQNATGSAQYTTLDGSGKKILASDIFTVNLSAFSADLGTCTAGTFTGGTVQTDAAANTGVKMTSAGIYLYDSSNNQVLFLDANAADPIVLAEGALVTDRGDPASYDFDEGDMSVSGSWTDLNLSSILPTGYHIALILFKGVIYDSATSQYIGFRRNGLSNNVNAGFRYFRGIASTTVNCHAQFIVFTDSSQIVEYQRSSGWTSFDVIVQAYWK